ncbi:hypothetical protein ACFYUY_01815 [Kitasatospora sp. NPDC004745]|uniref:hypothetical protein n=1 Tax=Kitasatospora sp. NPDC004745 TaxID=3364019 RepID=UPI00368A8EC4
MMDLFGRRRIAEQAERIARLDARVAQLNKALRISSNEELVSFRQSERFADHIIAVEKKLAATRTENAALIVKANEWADTAVDHAERLGRALRACARYRADNERLRREAQAARRDFAERQIALEDRLHDLQAANENHYRISATPTTQIAA